MNKFAAPATRMTVLAALWLSLLGPAALAEVARLQQGSEARLLTGVRQLTFEGRRAGEGYFSRDASMLIFQSEREPGNPFFQIYLMQLATGDVRRVSPGYGKTTCGWIHPDQGQILFASTHQDPEARSKQEEEMRRRATGENRRYSWDYDEHYDIFRADLQGDGLQNLTGVLGYDAEGSWSPDGDRIVFSSNRHAYAGPLRPEDRAIFEQDRSYLVDLYLMASDGSDVRRLTRAPGYDGGPFFSPDGESIVWRRFSPDGATAEIFVMDADGKEERQLTRLGAMSWAPYFHPSGDYLIFSTNREGFANFELYLVDSQGRDEPVRVTFTEGFDSLPVFSPDGTQLVWTSNRTASGESQLFAASWNDEEARRLLALAPMTSSPSAPAEQGKMVPDLPSTTGPITAQDLRLHVERLASASMEGRLTGSQGARRASEYVASAFESIGLEPAGEGGTYFQDFEFTAGVSLGTANHLTLHEGGTATVERFSTDRAWRPLAFSRTGKVGPLPVVFAGYGIVAPASGPHPAYDSYVHLEVKDHWVLVFRYLPEGVTPEYRQHLSRYAGLRYKAMVARDRGAAGLILVSGPNSQVKNQLVPLSLDSSMATTSLAVVSVTDDLAVRLLDSDATRLRELQQQLDGGDSVMGFPVPDLKLEADIEIQREKKMGRNVLARLRAAQPQGGAVMIGAHLDHLGRGLGAGSLAGPDEVGMIHFGADDNASGVAGVLEVAQYLVAEQEAGRLTLKRDLLLAAWSGEELGLLGSSHFVEALNGAQSRTPKDLIAAYLNMDMIGRLRESLILQGVGSSTVWRGEIESRNLPLGLPIVIQDDSYLPTDATSFYLKGVPVLNAFTGSHQEYHTPRDTSDRLNYQGAEKTVRLMGLITRSLLTNEGAPDYVAMERPDNPAARAGLRAYLGTVPDYAQGGSSGVKLSGVARGGPAEEAGVAAGDTIVELAGRRIENIYDYTYAIEALKVGAEVEMVVERQGRRLRLRVVPQSRE